MNPNTATNSAKLRNLQSLYNSIPNLIWSVLSLVPITVFCYRFCNHTLVYIFLAISILPIFFPNAFFDRIQLGKTTKIYKKLGAQAINRIVQNGDIINRLLKKQFPDFKVVTFQSRSAKKLLHQTYMYEKFHFMLFVFFSLIIIYAIINKYYGWALLLAFTNLAYNIYPNLLQQYLRIKLMALARRSK